MKNVTNYLLMCIVSIAMFVGYGCSQDGVGVLDNHWNQERQMSESEKYVKQVHYDTYLSIDRDKIVYNELTDEEKVIIRNAFARLTLKTSDDGQTTIIEKSGEDVNISDLIYNYIKLSLETGNNLIRRLNGKISGHNALSVASVKSRSLDYNGEDNDLDSIKMANDCVPLTVVSIAADLCNGTSPWTADAIFDWIVAKGYGSYYTGVSSGAIDTILDKLFEVRELLPESLALQNYTGDGKIMLILKSNGAGHVVKYLELKSISLIRCYDPQLARNQNLANNNNENPGEVIISVVNIYKAYVITDVNANALN